MHFPFRVGQYKSIYISSSLFLTDQSLNSGVIFFGEVFSIVPHLET